MELTGFPFWKFTYNGNFKIIGYLSQAQEFVMENEVSSILFYVNVMCTQRGVGGTEKTLGEREMTREELLSLTPHWLEQKMKDVAKEAEEYFFPKS